MLYKCKEFYGSENGCVVYYYFTTHSTNPEDSGKVEKPVKLGTINEWSYYSVPDGYSIDLESQKKEIELTKLDSLSADEAETLLTKGSYAVDLKWQESVKGLKNLNKISYEEIENLVDLSNKIRDIGSVVASIVELTPTTLARTVDMSSMHTVKNLKKESDKLSQILGSKGL